MAHESGNSTWKNYPSVATPLSAERLENIESIIDTLKAQVAENVSASTDSDADYAAEVADARVDNDGNTYSSLGDLIRDLTSKAIRHSQPTASISSDEDLDNFTTSGSYRCTTAASAVTLSNCPTTAAFRLDVIVTVSSGSFLIQVINDTHGAIYTRALTSSGWTDWVDWSDTATVSGTVSSVRPEASISSNEDLDDYTTSGSYRCANASISKTLENCPTTYAFRLDVITTLRDDEYFVQIINDNNGDIYTRALTSSGWTDWAEITMRYAIPTSGGVKNVLKRAKQMLNLPYTPLLDMLSANGSYVTRYFPANVAVKGVNYSSCWKYNGMVGNDISFETFCRSIEDPNSPLYTDEVLFTPSKRTSVRYGTVCSGFVSYALGLTAPGTVAELAKNQLTRRDDQSIYAVQLGDVLISSGHAQLVTKISYKNDDIHSVTVTESVHAATGTYEEDGKTYISGGSVVRTKELTREKFESNFEESDDADDDTTDYKLGIYYYPGIASTDYEASNWVAVEDESSVEHNAFTEISLPLGNKVNIASGTDFDLTLYRDPDTYNYLHLYKDGAFYESIAISADECSAGNLDTYIYTFSNDLPDGFYDIYNTNSSSVTGISEDDEHISFCIYSITATKSGDISDGEEVTVTFSCSDSCGTPSYLKVTGSERSPHFCYVLTDDEVAAGTATFTPNAISSSDQYCYLVTKNEYGICVAECV